MAWFKRKEKGITTATEDKKDVPKGLWYKSPTGKIVDTDELARNLWVSPEDDFHVRIGSKEYFEILFDNNEFKELDANLTSKDPLKFEDTKKYSDRLKEVMDKTKLKDAIRTGVGKSKGKELVVSCMDFAFIGGYSAVHQFTKIGEHAFVAGATQIRKDVPPYVKAAKNPVAYAGVNAIGLRRKGFSSEEIFCQISGFS